MYALTVLDVAALAAFRNEHPWLEFPEHVSEVCVYFDDNGGPTRLTALEESSDGKAMAPAVREVLKRPAHPYPQALLRSMPRPSASRTWPCSTAACAAPPESTRPAALSNWSSWM